MTQNFFIFGNHPRLGGAELDAVLEGGRSEECGGFAFVDGGKNIEKIFARLGGSVKCGTVVGEAHLNTISRELCDYIIHNRKTDQKVFFGLSAYGSRLDTRRIGLAIKKMLAAQGANSRFVISRETALSSVVVQTNKLLSNRGIELVLLFCGNKRYFGETRAVQPFAEFSLRDYGRPMRDSRSGMIPPKLARIMINLARAPKTGVILDPFCGSGTILQEALIMGYSNVIGSDISQKAINGTKINFAWLEAQASGVKSDTARLILSDARFLSQTISMRSVDAIITEPYLGPPLKDKTSENEINRTMNDLEQLYRKSIAECAKILHPRGALVIIFPIIQNKRIPLECFIESGFIQDKFFDKFYDDHNRKSFIYQRERQLVAREIFILRR